MGQRMPQMSYCTWVHLYTHSYKPKRRHCHCQTETGSSNWAATSGIPPSFLEISASIKVILLHLKSPFPFSPFCIIFFFLHVYMASAAACPSAAQSHHPAAGGAEVHPWASPYLSRSCPPITCCRLTQYQMLHPKNYFLVFIALHVWLFYLVYWL